ncbi:hypothetical protein K788_0006468 [Paraburkholderia caribensis MBA4]|uniref:Uncharacterized protein n=1 Tax=Paraburkholderia caribensis MBA4 TaxID=1323664 RepID=A0A0P0RBZ8_9BURK|nr:hypothetical protein K788_0006468 [Paraburkholderia caribensis MBA4]
MAWFSLSYASVPVRTKDIDLMFLIGYNLSNRTGFAKRPVFRVYR